MLKEKIKTFFKKLKTFIRCPTFKKVVKYLFIILFIFCLVGSCFQKCKKSNVKAAEDFPFVSYSNQVYKRLSVQNTATIPLSAVNINNKFILIGSNCSIGMRTVDSSSNLYAISFYKDNDILFDFVNYTYTASGYNWVVKIPSVAFYWYNIYYDNTISLNYNNTAYRYFFTSTTSNFAYSNAFVILTNNNISYSSADLQQQYQSGYNTGLNDGYNNAFTELSDNYKTLEEYNNYGANQYQKGLAAATKNDYSFYGLFSSVLSAPYLMLKDAFDFELFGINLSDFIIVILSIAVVVFIISIFKRSKE